MGGRGPADISVDGQVSGIRLCFNGAMTPGLYAEKWLEDGATASLVRLPQL